MGLVVEDDGWRIPDEVWAQMEPLLPPRPSHPLGLRGTPHFDELPLATVRPVREDADGSEAGPLVHSDRPAVEAGDGERELLGREAAAGVPEPCLEEAFTETLSCPFGMEAEADLEPRALRLFVVEESDQAAALVLDRDVIVASRRRVEQLGEIIRVGRPVVE